MKKTWKRWLGTVAAALVTSTALAQSSNDVGVATTRGQSPSFSEEGSVRMGRASASARGTRIQQSQYAPSMDAGDVVEDAMGRTYMPGAQGGTIFSDDGAVGFASTERVNDILWRVGNQSLNAYGYNGGYTNLNAFVPIFSDGSQNVLFAIPRVNFTDYGKLGANLGVGYRTYVPENDRVFGVSGWWDYDDGHRSSYQQWGMNFESIGRWLSLRGGFALPSGNDSFIYNTTLGDAQFVGNNIVATQTQFFERSYANYNAEVATPLPGLARYGFDVGMGMYVLQSPGLSNIVGGSLRTQAQLTESAWMNATYTYDHHYQSMFSLNVELSLPDGPPKQWFRRNSVQHSLTDNVIRNYRIAVTEQSKSQQIILTNPGGGGGGGGGGSPISVVFIDANAASTGDGTRANPFQTLSAYMALTDTERDLYDIIYIRGMMDGSGTNLTTGLTLLDTQKVLGDGLLPNGSRPTLTTAQGGISLPGTNGPLPLLSNLDNLLSPVLTLANANEISGIRIDGSSNVAGSDGRGIVGTGIDSFNIHDTFISNVITGIDITSDTTQVLPPGVVDNYGVIKNVSVTAGSSGTKGISLIHNAGTLDLLVTGNTITGFQGEDANNNGLLDLGEDANNNGVLDPGEDKDFDGVLDISEDKNNNAVLDLSQAMYIVADGATINANNPTSTTRPTGITSNTFTSNGRGLHLLATNGGDFSATVANNTSTGATDANGAAFLIEADGAGSTMNLLDSINNVASGGLGDGLVLVNRNGGTLNVLSSIPGQSPLAGNSYTNNGGDGLKIVADNATITIGSLSNLVFTGNTGDGLELQATNGGILNVANAMVFSQFTNNGGNGLNLNAAGGTVNINIGRDVVNSDGSVTRQGNTFTGNDIAGLAFNSSAGGVINTDIRNNNASNNDGDGIRFNLVGTTLSPLTIQRNTVDNNGGNGLAFFATAGSVLNNTAIRGNSLSDNTGGDGLLVDLADSTATQIDISQNLLDRNRDNGISVDLDNGDIGTLNIVNNAGALVNFNLGMNFLVTGSTANSAGTTPTYSLTNTSTGTGANIELTNFSLNTSPLTADTAGTGSTPFAAFGTTALTTGLQSVNGVTTANFANAVADGATNLNMTFNDFDTTESMQWNLGLEVPAVGTTPAAVATGADLVGRTVTASFQDPNNKQFTGTITGVLTAAAGGAGGAQLQVTQNSSYRSGMSSNGDSGLSIDARDGSNIGTLLVQGNNIESNQSAGGVYMYVSTDSNISTASTGGIIGNQINNNVGFNVGLTMDENATATMYIQDNSITGARALPNTTWIGDGINIQLTDTAVLNGGAVRHNQVTGNAGSGLAMSVLGNNDLGNLSTFDAARIDNFVIGGPLAADGNLFQGNGVNGVSIVREERGQINDMLIQNNIMNANTNDGLNVNVSGASQANLLNGRPDSMNIISNNFTNNGGDGVEFRTGSDADLLANMDLNLVRGNARNGIYLSEAVNEARDSRSMTGVWTRNRITNNTFSGIQLQGHMGNVNNDVQAGLGLVIGDVTPNPIGSLLPLGNLISQNRLDGIQITGGGVVNIGANTITLNGTATQEIVAPGTVPVTVYNNAGINIQGPEFENGTVSLSGAFPSSLDDVAQIGVAFREVRVVSNLISQNVGDGVRFLNEPGVDDFGARSTLGGPQAGISTSLTLLTNEITQNKFRGVNVLNRPGDAATDLDNTDPNGTPQLGTAGGIIADLNIIGNHIKGNKQEGIYIVNTNSEDQRIMATSEQLLTENGLVGTGTYLRADIHNNQIIGNGSEVVNFPATGLVVRVGTSGGGYSYADDGGFATSGTNAEDLNGDGVLDNDLNGDGLLNASANDDRAGISMSVTGNTFDGNWGSDVLFHSFRSTVDPGTGTTWSETEFDPSGFQGDPLARLDLVFSNNRFSSMEGNNENYNITDGLQPGAYYNDADGVFKSRLISDDPTTGPFGDAARIRNAQRQASRYATNPPQLNPQPGATAEFPTVLYAGMGNSTFRVRGSGNAYTDQGLGSVTIDEIFILDQPQLVGDPTLVDAEFEARGVLPAPTNITNSRGELPWGWGEF